MSNSYYFITSLTLILTTVVCLYQSDYNLKQSSIILLPELKAALSEMLTINICADSAVKQQTNVSLLSFSPHCSWNPSYFSETFSHELPQPCENSLITWVWMCLVGISFFLSFFALWSVSDLRPWAEQPSGPLSAKRGEPALLQDFCTKHDKVFE